MEEVYRTFVDNAEVAISVDNMTPTDYWNNRYEYFQRYQRGLEVFNSMSEDDLDLLKHRVRGCLEYLYDTVDDWFPESFRSNVGDQIVIEMMLQVVDHEKEIKRRSQELSFKVRDAKRELKRYLEDEQDEA